MTTLTRNIGRGAVFLLFLAAPFSANAILINPGDTLRADFDLSGLTPAPPWDFLSVRTLFSPHLPMGESYTLDLFDFSGGPTIASRVFGPSGVDAVSVSLEMLLTPSDLLDSIGVLEYTFSTTVDVANVFVQGRNLPLGTDDTPFVLASLTVVPAPTTLSLLGAGLIGFVLTRRRRQTA